MEVINHFIFFSLYLFIFYIHTRLKHLGGKDGTTEKLFKASSRGSVYNKVFNKNMDKNYLRTDADGVVNMVESELDVAFFGNPLKLRDKQIFCKVSSEHEKSLTFMNHDSISFHL